MDESTADPPLEGAPRLALDSASVRSRRALEPLRPSPSPDAATASSVGRKAGSEILDRLHGLLQRCIPDSTCTLSESGSQESSLLAGRTPAASGADASPDLLAPPLNEGELGRLGDFSILRALGAGGMGIVFEAEDVRLKRRVALKIMRPEWAASSDARRRFLAEARAVAAVEHERIVVIHQVGELEGVPYFVMQLLQGESLARRLARPPLLPVEEALRIGMEIAEGLAAAHARGLVHRDVKPANVWLDANGGRVKLLDFGLVRDLDLKEDGRLSKVHALIGTPSYMSPEQSGSQPVDARTDLFSLGAVLYRMLSGRLPFEGESLGRILAEIACCDPPSIAASRPEVPPAVDLFVRRLLEKDRSRRPASADEVVAELARLWAACSLPPADFHGRSGSGRGLLLAAAGAAAFILLAGTWVVVRDRQGKETARIPLPEGGSVALEGEKKAPAPSPPPTAAPASTAVASTTTAPRVPASTTNVSTTKASAATSPSASASTAAPARPQPERGTRAYFQQQAQAAERLQKMGAKLTIDASGVVIGVDLRRVGFDVEEFEAVLEDLPDLNYLHSGKRLTRRSMERMGKLPSLQTLLFFRADLDDEDLLPLVEAPRLESLTLLGCPRLTDGILEHLARMKNLRILNFMDSRGVTGRGMHRLAPLERLEILNLGSASLIDDDLRAIGKMRKLVYVNLAGGYGDGGLEALAELSALVRLDLRSPGITDAGVGKLLPRLPKLKFLAFGGTKLTGACLDVFADSAVAPDLVEFVANRGSFTDQALLKLLAARPKLKIELDRAPFPPPAKPASTKTAPPAN